MDIIRNFEPTEIPLIHQPIRDAFLPELEKHRAEIESVKSETFKYGSTDRHQLDVYYPPADAIPLSGKVPVLYFFYGGGFFEGDRRLATPYELVYTNLGAYFAKRGNLTVISDYRLVPGAKFPEPVEDVRDAIQWVVANADEVLSGTGIQADFDHVFLMSHSAGSTHTSTLLLHPSVLPADLRRRIHGVILKGGVYSFERDESMSPNASLLQLYGSWDAIEANMPATLLQRAPGELFENFPKVTVLVSEREPDGFIENSKSFAAALETRLGRSIPIVVMKDHNHLSPHWALGTGAGEEWAEEVTKWIKDNAPSA
ncbi:Alpha/Beta hydrolase protein [Rhodofomes roseus]|uniref:Alpha/Beta hydrolase protein n=1 Tax=Rhodofomes roseus TaxID=34475 RepID=A0ABQ8KRS5_9APHY|nr:Alpha/Beta hydrolase protein [Rhodofomes roseus]KAH9840820.1 Alpha/Beta hydrolase protein [Rhodofomes roseus]